MITVQPSLSLQAARGLAALIIVGSHVSYLNAQYMSAQLASLDFTYFGEVGCDLLFVLSGFSLVVSDHYQFGLKGQVSTFLKRRFFRIYPLYWAYFLAVSVVLRMEPDLVHRSPSDVVDLIPSILLLPQASPPMFRLAWTLVQLMWCYLVLATFLRLSLNHLVVTLCCWAALIFYAVAWLPSPHNTYLRVMVHASSLEFIFGALAGVAYLKLLRFSPETIIAEPLMLAIGVGSIGYALSRGLIDHTSVSNFMPWPRAVDIGAGTALMLLFFALQEAKGQVKIPALLKTIGDLSYSLLLSYVFTLGMCSQIGLGWANGEGSVWQAGFFELISFALALLVAGCCHLLVEKPFSRYCTRFLDSSAPVAFTR